MHAVPPWTEQSSFCRRALLEVGKRVAAQDGSKLQSAEWAIEATLDELRTLLYRCVPELHEELGRRREYRLNHSVRDAPPRLPGPASRRITPVQAAWLPRNAARLHEARIAFGLTLKGANRPAGCIGDGVLQGGAASGGVFEGVQWCTKNALSRCLWRSCLLYQRH